MAALVGIGFPIVKIGQKTLSGTLAGLLACALAGKAMGLPVSDFVIFSGASVAMIMELIPLPVDDNVSIPLSAGLAMAVLGSTV